MILMHRKQDKQRKMKEQRPVYHFTPSSNWMNDPNGLIYFGGRYHLFYQHFPYAPVWGRMHWGHAVSSDMVNWEYLPIAVFPSKSYDLDGVFSGSAIEIDGRINFYYTAIHYRDYNPENTNLCGNLGFEANQAVITSVDGFSFDHFNDKKIAVPMLTDTSLGSDVHTRDPKVWKYKDRYYMVLGSRFGKDGMGEKAESFTPELLFYTSEDGFSWEYKNRAVMNEDYGFMWECPDVFTVNGETVAVFSPQGIMEKPQTDLACFGIVDFDNDSCEMKLSKEKMRPVDFGLDYYAPQSFTDKDGRRVQIGWLRMKKPRTDMNGTEWIGCYTIPRVVTAENGKIFTRPHPNLREKFEVFDSVQPGRSVYCIKKALNIGESIDIGGYVLRRTEDSLTALRDGTEYSAPCEGLCEVEIYIDNCVIETYINDGEAVISHVI